MKDKLFQIQKNIVNHWFELTYLNSFAGRRYHLLITFSISFIGFIVHVILLVNRFNSKPTTQIFLHQKLPLQWPLITICPDTILDKDRFLNHYNSSVDLLNEFKSVQQQYIDIWNKTLLIYYNNNNNNNNKAENIDRNMLEYFSLYSMYNHENISSRFGFNNPADRIITCYFSGNDCNFQNFTILYHPTKFNCFQFNVPPRQLISSGKVNGLTVILDVGYFYYNQIKQKPQVSKPPGYLVTITEQKVLPDFWKNTLIIPVGRKVDFEIEAVRYSHLESKKKCYNKNEWLSLFGYAYKDNFIQKELISNCSCFSELFYNTFNMTAEKSCFHFNNKSNLHSPADILIKLKCHDDIISKFNKFYEKSKALLSCDYVDYNMRTFAADWPLSLRFLNILIKESIKKRKIIFSDLQMTLELDYLLEFERKYKYLKQSNSELQKIIGKSRFNMFTFYVTSTYMDWYKEEQVYPIENLLSDVAGALGMWIGITAVTVIEFVHFFIISVYQVCLKKTTNSKVEPKQDNTTSTSTI